MNKQFRMFLLVIGILFAMTGWADTKTSTLTFTAKCNGSGTADDGVAWTVTSDGKESNFEKDRGIHYGTGKAAVGHLTLSTSGITGKITQVVVNASGASNTEAQLNVSVGGTAFGTSTEVQSSAADYTFTGSAQGDIVVKLSQEKAKKGLYVKSISVSYVSGLASPSFSLPSGTYDGEQTVTLTTSEEGAEIHYTTDGNDPTATSTKYSDPLKVSTTQTIKAVSVKEGKISSVSSASYVINHTVSSIAELKKLASGTEVALILSDGEDGSMARVLYVNGTGDTQEAFIRDNTGAVCFYGIKPNVPFAYNQHIAGRISGKYVLENGLPKFQATENTNTTRLIIAGPITETDVTSRQITSDEYDQHTADWVMLKDLHIKSSGLTTDENLVIKNQFNLGSTDLYADAYEGAVVDISGIIYPKGAEKFIYPVHIGDNQPVTFVIDQDREFVSPQEELGPLAVRLKRTLSTFWWNTFCVPFDITDIENATVTEFTGKVDGATMLFKPARAIEAGVPYLVKWNKENPTFKGVMLKSTPAKEVKSENGLYAFVGTYGVTTLKDDKTERFLGDGDLLYWPDASSGANYNRLPGMRAFYRVPASATGAKVVFETTGISSFITEKDRQPTIYNLNGQKMKGSLSDLKKGIYIINGKKVIIK